MRSYYHTKLNTVVFNWTVVLLTEGGSNQHVSRGDALHQDVITTVRKLVNMSVKLSNWCQIGVMLNPMIYQRKLLLPFDTCFLG